MNWDGDLSLPRAVFHELGIHEGVSLFLASEVPPGTGLGSSSAVAVALIQVLAGYLRRPLTRHQIAELACKVELQKLGAPIGKQDQFAAAFGGLNAISFTHCGVNVSPLQVPVDTLDRLNGRLLLYFTGTARNSANILRAQQTASAREDGRALKGLHQIRRLADACVQLLEDGDLDGVGELLHEGWLRKRSLAAGISNERIDGLYDTARAHGAIGGKITGAGGGGFLLLCCHEGRQVDVAAAMERQGLRRMDFRFEPAGVMVSALHWHGMGDLLPALATA